MQDTTGEIVMYKDSPNANLKVYHYRHPAGPSLAKVLILLNFPPTNALLHVLLCMEVGPCQWRFWYKTNVAFTIPAARIVSGPPDARFLRWSEVDLVVFYSSHDLTHPWQCAMMQRPRTGVG